MVCYCLRFLKRVALFLQKSLKKPESVALFQETVCKNKNVTISVLKFCCTPKMTGKGILLFV